MWPLYFFGMLVLILGFHVATSLASSAQLLGWEHSGDLFSKVSRTSCPKGVLTNGTATGEMQSIGGIDTYLAYPPSNQTETAILYLTDIFGLPLINNKLLGDSFAKAGYFVVMPDLFAGDAVPIDGITNPNFNFTAWREKHTVELVDGIVDTVIKAMRSNLDVDTIGAVGYCFGGKYVARFLAAGKGLDAGFAAHPSSVDIAEWSNIAGPLSIAYGELDNSNTPAQRATTEAALIAKNATYQTSLYAQAEHGFAVRTDVNIKQKEFAQQAAYFQAVRWFDSWLN